MAIFRIYPEKDTTIWSEPNISNIYGNAGLDEILEVGTYKDIDDTHRVQRSLIQFYTNQIQSTINSKVTGQWTGSLHLSLAEAGSLPEDYVLHALAVNGSWTTGLGKRDDLPLNKSGCSWKYKGAQQDAWTSLGGDYISSSLAFVSKSVKLSQDLDIDVTNIVHSHYSSSYGNAGIMLKLSPDNENNTTSSINLKYFGSDTNTIFPPYLEFKWDDSSYSSSLTELSTDIATIGIKNHKEKYADTDSIRFRLSARPKYPTRTFTTSSIYLTEYKLPQLSYWGVKDEYSGEMIVDFSNHTKISADNTSSYFDIYMESFQPERYYRLLVKTTVNDSTIVIDNKNIFKVTRHG
tara:strand:+ start:5600 stop:6646 length:1047 start_codon:yes stop_codon:yes gene_type:complete